MSLEHTLSLQITALLVFPRIASPKAHNPSHFTQSSRPNSQATSSIKSLWIDPPSTSPSNCRAPQGRLNSSEFVDSMHNNFIFDNFIFV